MSVQMMRSAQRATRPVAARRSTVLSAGSGKTVSGKTVSGKRPSEASESKRKDDVDAYLLTLPGYGLESGPFEGPWDPLNLADTASVNDMRRWRESELTHGRVGMLAAVGFVVGEQVQDSQLLFNFDGHVTGPAILQFQQLKQGFWEPLLIAIGLAESFRTSVGWASPLGGSFNALKGEDEYTMGDLGFDPLGLAPKDEDELRILKTKELNNGRLAMIAIAGFVLQEVAEPGVEIFEHLFVGVGNEVAVEADVVESELPLL